jgi:hypothetical protein
MFVKASMGGTLITHPLDTVKVQLQTQKAKQFGFLSTFTSQYFKSYNREILFII